MRNRKTRQIVFTCLFSFLIFLLSPSDRVAAQERKGSISGHASDNAGGVLKGARIEVKPESFTVVSDAQGDFFIGGVDPGSYEVVITYVGFKDFSKQINVAAGQTAGIEATMEVGSQNLQVLVTADRAAGEAEELNRQRTADNVVQV